MSEAVQDRYAPSSICFGCGPANEEGLRIKSFRDGEGLRMAFQPQTQHQAFPGVINGGIIGARLDCHGIWTAIADAYRREERDIGSGTPIWYVTASLHVQYRKPTPIDLPLSLVGRATEASERKTLVSCSLTSDGVERATAELVAVRVPLEWFTGQHG